MQLFNFTPTRLFVIGIIVLISVGVKNTIEATQEETPGHKTCKKDVEGKYQSELTPLLRDLGRGGSGDADQIVKKYKNYGEKEDALKHIYLEKWWACHIEFLSKEDKRKIVLTGRWDEYVNLVSGLSSIWDRYIFEEATTVLSSKGHINTVAEILAMHKK